MDLIDRNELNKKILNLMQNYIGDDWSDGVSVCGKVLQIIASMEAEGNDICHEPLTWSPGVREGIKPNQYAGEDKPPIVGAIWD